MQTNLKNNLLSAELTHEAEKILRSCVHCGFCTATCPTYQIFSDELDGPRGRIYLIKQMLEGAKPGKTTLTHLDRCLTCRSCETTCPSGVNYARLLETGKDLAEKIIKRRLIEKLARKYFLSFMLSKKLFPAVINSIQIFLRILPGAIRSKVSISRTALDWPVTEHKRKVLLLTGCAQNTLAPDIDRQLAHLLDRCSVQVIPVSGCCGALPQHMSAEEKARSIIKNNIDQWQPYIKKGIEAIIMSSSGCGVTLKDYRQILQYDLQYKDKAEQISSLVKDPVELLEDQFDKLKQKNNILLSFHAPCTLQHGLGMHTHVESLLKKLGYTLNTVKDAHMCCGSAGSYSVFHPIIANKLLVKKLASLEEQTIGVIATSNIGCLLHLKSKARYPVKHWLSLVYENLDQ